MPPTQLPRAPAQRHNNQQRFSDHYLNITLPQRPDGRLLALNLARAVAQGGAAPSSATDETGEVV